MEENSKNPATPRLWIDADACPGETLDLAVRMGVRRGVNVILVANARRSHPRGDGVAFVVVSGDFNAADDHIAGHAQAGDLAVTDDIPLASRLAAGNVFLVTARGEELNADNIGERLAMRNLMEDLRAFGLASGGPKEYGRADRERFANTLDRLLTRALRGRADAR